MINMNLSFIIHIAIELAVILIICYILYQLYKRVTKMTKLLQRNNSPRNLKYTEQKRTGISDRTDERQTRREHIINKNFLNQQNELFNKKIQLQKKQVDAEEEKENEMDNIESELQKELDELEQPDSSESSDANSEL